MQSTEYTIDRMRESDLPQAVDVLNEAFRRILKHFLGSVPPGRSEGERVANRFYNPGCQGLVLRDAAGVAQGVAFVQQYGTRSVGGPIGIRSTVRSPEAAFDLVKRATELSAELGCECMDSVTFPHSAFHFVFHWRRGSDPTFPAPFMVKSVRRRDALLLGAPGALTVRLLSQNETDEREQALQGMSPITNAFHPGFDVTAEARHVLGRSLGEVFVAVRDGRQVGFAVCHFGPGSEAFADDQLLVKLLFVDPTVGETEIVFQRLLEEIELLAHEDGFGTVGAMASAGRRASVRALMVRGYTVTEMHQEWPSVHGAPDLFVGRAAVDFTRPDQFALAELR